MSAMMKLIEDLHMVRSGIVCDGIDYCMERLQEDLPFHILRWPSGDYHNGWIVPKKWECQQATIIDHTGKLLYNGNDHPLGVIGYSQSYRSDGFGIMGDELKKHLFYNDTHHDALVHHCDLFYKPHKKDWGFSVSKNFYDTIDDAGIYHVDLKTTFEDGEMPVAEYIVHGKSRDTILLLAHICHPGCSNDDLSGCAVGIEVMKRLIKMLGRNHYTYRLLILPEHYGSVFYMKTYRDKFMKYAMFIESVGTTGPLINQESFDPRSLICRAVANSLPPGGESKPFRSVVGNDETVLEAVGIPCPSLNRCHFSQYHSSHDNPSLMNEDSLYQAAEVVMNAIDIMENDTIPVAQFDGLVCLSNPQYDLYRPMMDPSIPDRRSITPEARRFNYLMDCLPQLLDGKHSILDIAERHQLPFRAVFDYVKKWQEKGLVEMVRT